MFDKRFCYIGGTGRNGTHWLDKLFRKYGDDNHVASFHDGLPARLKIRGNPRETLVNYWLNLMVRSHKPETYVECNPAFLEWVALAHRIGNPNVVIPDGLLIHKPRAVVVVRHPDGYVKSLLARGWGWTWWKFPGFLHTTEWNRSGPFVRLCLAWNWKMEFFGRLEDAFVVRYEDLFGDNSLAEDVADHLGINLSMTSAELRKFKGERVASKGGQEVVLSNEQKKTIRGICGTVMGDYGYE